MQGVGAVGERVGRVVMHFDENSIDADRNGGRSEGFDEPGLTAGNSARAQGIWTLWVASKTTG